MDSAMVENIQKPSYDPWKDALVWIMLPSHGDLWLPGFVTENLPPLDLKGEWKFIVKLENSSVHNICTIAVDDYDLEFQLVKRRSCDTDYIVRISDMTLLPFLNEPEMVECIRRRYLDDLIYTNVGPILIAINPCRNLPYYSQEVFETYFNSGSFAEFNTTTPHIFQMTDRAYRRMMHERKSQSILITGESGAGKTESTKRVFSYLVQLSSILLSNMKITKETTDIENQVISTNPITESFGNSKTVRNNNSSRFGKFIEVIFSREGYIEGARIRTYLLETIRITRQLPGERNFHIFYEVAASLSEAELQLYQMQKLDDFHYTGQSGDLVRDDGESDLENYYRLCDAMTVLEMPADLQEEVMRIVIVILHLGNIEFDETIVSGVENAKFRIETSKHIQLVCELLGTDSGSLETALTKRSLHMSKGNILTSLSADRAVTARDTLARTLYDSLFKWLVSGINSVMSSQVPRSDHNSHSRNSSSSTFIGVLDISGYEYFGKNSFEQLCINYTNEKLQDHFNYAIFKSEQEVYEEEGLQWTFVDYPDNSVRLDLLENPSYGVLNLLNEQLKVPKPSDKKFAQSLYEKCTWNRYFYAGKYDRAVEEFVILHFAGAVRYTCSGFLSKNSTEVSKELHTFLHESSNPILKLIAEAGLFPRMEDVGVTFHMKRDGTIASQFRIQLDDLMAKIRSTRSHFVRCIKPNEKLQPGKLDVNMVTQQLRCGGALGAVQVFRAGFPNRVEFESFVKRYGSFAYLSGANPLTKDVIRLMSLAWRTGSALHWRLAASKLISVVPLAEIVLRELENSSFGRIIAIDKGLQTGKTQIFMKAEVYDYIEKLRMLTIIQLVRRVQLLYRARSMYRKTLFRTKHAYKITIDALFIFAKRKYRQASKHFGPYITLQRFSRTALSVIHFRRAMMGIVKLQARFRGWMARMLVWEIPKAAATYLQASYRKFKARRIFLRIRYAIICIQKRYRGHRFRRKWFQICTAISKLQGIYRGQSFRRARAKEKTQSIVHDCAKSILFYACYLAIFLFVI